MGSSRLASLSRLGKTMSGTRGRKPSGAEGTKSGRRKIFVASLFLLLGLTAAGCGGYSASGPLSVAVTPGGAVVPLGGTQTFSATVSNDPKSQGVTWTLTLNGTACSPSCGTVSPTSSASGASVTYSAPGTAIAVTLTATSVTETGVYSAAIITVTGNAAISVSPSSASVALTGTQQFFATVANDTSNKGVNWTLTQNGTACSPACGTVSPTSTTSGVATTYTAPATAPTSSAVVTLTADSIAFPGSTAWATITIGGGITVSLAPSYVANVSVNGTQQLVATVTNDTSNKGVNWTLTQNGQSCSPGCGSIAPTSTASGAPTTYTAPAKPTTVTVTATSVADNTKSSFATLNVEGISVSVSPTIASLHQGATLTLDALVSNDVKNGGVTWSLLENGQSCSPGCGTISPTTTGSGVTTTYTTPSTVSNQAVLTAKATSVTDNTQSGSATINLYPPIAVSVSPNTASVAVSSRTSFTATVVNDFSNSGVNWTLSQNGNACSPTCGIVSPTNTASGVATTYFAPSAVPSPSQVTLTASSAVSVGVSGTATITVGTSAIAAKFAGNYAFQFNGYDAGGTIAMAGNFTVDGSSNITGIEDSNSASGVTTAQAFTGTYTIGADGQGTFTLVSSPQGVSLGSFRFALNSTARQAPFAEMDDAGARGTGLLLRTESAPASPASLKGNFTFGVSGIGQQGETVAMAGKFQADGTGNVTGGQFDLNDGGAVAMRQAFQGTYTLGASGRGILSAHTPTGVLHWAFYAVSPKRVFLVSADPRYAGPVSSGSAMSEPKAQAEGYSIASLSGTDVIRFSGSSGVDSTKVAAGLVTFDGAGGLSYSIDENDGGHVRSLTGVGLYTVSQSGRAELILNAPGSPLVVYLNGTNAGLVVGTGTGASSGTLEAQGPGPFDNSSLTGDYIFRTMATAAGSAIKWGTMKAGEGQIRGTAWTKNATGVKVPAANFAEGYLVTPVGRAKLGSGGAALYVISPSQAVMIDLTPGQRNPTITEVVK